MDFLKILCRLRIGFFMGLICFVMFHDQVATLPSGIVQLVNVHMQQLVVQHKG